MDFLDRLRMLARNKGLDNNMQLSKASGVPYTTLDNFYRNGYENVKLSTLKKLAVCLDCTIEYLVNGSGECDAPSSEAIAFAQRFEKLDRHAQQVLLAVMRVEEKRIEEAAEEAAFARSYLKGFGKEVPIVGEIIADGSVETRYAAQQEVKVVIPDPIPQLRENK